MESVQKNFMRRQQAIRKKHRRMAEGYVTRVNKTGVIEHRPKRKFGSVTLMPFIILALVFLAFKIVLIGQLGEETYLAHVDNLAAGSVVERVGAKAMQIDPVTVMIMDLARAAL